MITELRPTEFPWMDPSRYTFSLGVQGGGALWLAGETGASYGPDGATLPAGIGDQARVAWDKIQAVLGVADSDMSACTEIVEYVTTAGLGELADIARARPGAAGPGSIMVIESLVRPEPQVEVEVVAGGPSGQVRLPQILPVDEEGGVVARGDLVAQAAYVLDRAGQLLADHGLDHSHIVRIVQQTTPETRREYRSTEDARRRLLGPLFPASTGVLVPALPVDGALVALDVWASEHPKRVINPGWSAFDDLTFSPAVRAGDILYISGTTAWDPDTNTTVAPGEIAAQARFVYEQIEAICQAAGGSIGDVVKTIEYVAPAGFDGYRSVAGLRRELLDRPFPAATGVVVSGLLGRQWLIEVEAVAVLA